MAAPKKIDYERIEPAWRAGIQSPAQLAAAYTEETGVAVSHAAIIKHFKKLGVPRDLAAKVRAKADAMVMEAMVTGKVSAVTMKRESEIVEDSAVVQANVRLSHRADIVRFRNIALSLLSELEVETGSIDIFVELGVFLRDEDEKGVDKRNDIYQKVISSSGRIDGLKKLAETLKILITLEREAYGIAAAGEKSDAVDNLAVALEAARKRRRDVA